MAAKTDWQTGVTPTASRTSEAQGPGQARISPSYSPASPRPRVPGHSSLRRSGAEPGLQRGLPVSPESGLVAGAFAFLLFCSPDCSAPPSQPPIKCEERIPGHFHFLCSSRAPLLFNPAATRAASSVPPAPPIHLAESLARSRFPQGKLGGGWLCKDGACCREGQRPVALRAGLASQESRGSLWERGAAGLGSRGRRSAGGCGLYTGRGKGPSPVCSPEQPSSPRGGCSRKRPRPAAVHTQEGAGVYTSQATGPQIHSALTPPHFN